jgi:hypothetical protein
VNKVGIIILNWNGYKDTIECLESIVKYEKDKYTVYLLDNGSTNGSDNYIEKWIKRNYKYNYEILDEEKFVNYEEIKGTNLVFIKGNINLGFANKIKNTYKYSLLLNNDTIITHNAITTMVNYMDNNVDTGALSCNIRYFSDRTKLWNAGGDFTWYGDRKYIKQNQIDKLIRSGEVAIKTPFVTGCALMIRREILLDYGILTEKFFFGEEDFNFCRRLKKNKIKVETLLTSTIYHKVSSSIKNVNSNPNKTSNRYVLHFSNRIINQKEFYNYKYWVVWRYFYIMAVLIKILLITKDIKATKYTINRINKLTRNNNEVDYELFKKINEA